MDTRIVVILPNGALVKMVETVLARMDLELPVYEMQTEDALDLAARKIREGTQIIISRGMTGAYLRNRLSVPVFEIKYDFFHFAAAMREALLLNPEISVIGFIEQYRLAERAREYVQGPGQRVHVDILPAAEQVEQTILAMGKRGVNTFVGGSLVTQTARRLGYRAVLVEADEKAVRAAVDEALYELRIGMEREERYSLIATILNSASNGVFAVDVDGGITAFNPIAKSILARCDPAWRNKPIQEIMPASALSRALRDGCRINDDLVQIGQNIIAVNAIPILMENVPHGAVITIQDADKIQKLDFEIRKKRMDRGHVARTTLDDVIGGGDAIRACKDRARSYAGVDGTVLILGETGTGKEMFAQSIHNLSRRSRHPFVAVNCAALAPSLLESELFGYVKGAFTGARNEGKAGIFELAHTGTIFLDEIGELPLDVQSRLLRVIQEKQLTRIGDDSVIPVDVRILAATNRDLEKDASEGRFRKDLYYRLGVLELRLPSLFERKEDIPMLVRHFVAQKCREAGRDPAPTPDRIIALFQRMPLRGNIRELINLVERALVIGHFAELDETCLEGVERGEGAVRGLGGETPEPAGPSRRPARRMEDVEMAAIRAALAECGNNKSAAAKLLGISVSTLWRRLKVDFYWPRCILACGPSSPRASRASTGRI